MALKYCDYIADVIKKSLCADEGLVSEVGHIQMDLHPEEGYFVSTKKTIPVKDVNGENRKKYEQYKQHIQPNMTFIGRCGMYVYIDMHQAINSALSTAEKFLENNK